MPSASWEGVEVLVHDSVVGEISSAGGHAPLL